MNKRLINGQKILLNLFNELIEAIFNNNRSVNEDNVSVNENNNVSVNEGDNVSINEDNNNENESDSESQNGDEEYYLMKQLNNYLKTIDEIKSSEEQIEILKKEHLKKNIGT